MTTAVRMPRKSLPGVITQSAWLPPMICLYGDGGIGKSTFGASASRPVFVTTEAGVDNLDVARFPVAGTLDEFLSNVSHVAAGEHDYGTIVIDTLNGLMHLYHEAKKGLLNHNGKPAYDFVGFGGHSGWGAAANDIRSDLFPLLHACKRRDMFVVILAHAGTYTDKTSIDDVIKTGASINKIVWKTVLGEMDVVGKAEYVFSVKSRSGDVIRASTDVDVVNGVRVKQRRIVFEGGMEVDAKTRIGYELPPELPLSWSEFEKHLGNKALVAAEVLDMWEYVEPDKRATTLEWLGVDSVEKLARANRSRLTQLRNRLREIRSNALAEASAGERADSAIAAPVDESRTGA